MYHQNLPCSKTACATAWQLVATAPMYSFSLRVMSSSAHIYLYKRRQSEETVPEKVRTHSLLFFNEYIAAVRRRSRIQARCRRVKFQCGSALRNAIEWVHGGDSEEQQITIYAQKYVFALSLVHEWEHNSNNYNFRVAPGTPLFVIFSADSLFAFFDNYFKTWPHQRHCCWN